MKVEIADPRPNEPRFMKVTDALLDGEPVPTEDVTGWCEALLRENNWKNFELRLRPERSNPGIGVYTYEVLLGN